MAPNGTNSTAKVNMSLHQIRRRNRIRASAWTAFAVAVLLLLNIGDLILWAAVVVASAMALAAIPALRPSAAMPNVDGRRRHGSRYLAGSTVPTQQPRASALALGEDAFI